MRNAPCCFFEYFCQTCNGVLDNTLDRSAHADAGFDHTWLTENRYTNTAYTNTVFFIVGGHILVANFFQLTQWLGQDAFELMKSMIEVGAACVHFEDRLSSPQKCGHLSWQSATPKLRSDPEISRGTLGGRCHWCSHTHHGSRRRKQRPSAD